MLYIANIRNKRDLQTGQKENVMHAEKMCNNHGSRHTSKHVCRTSCGQRLSYKFGLTEMGKAPKDELDCGGTKSVAKGWPVILWFLRDTCNTNKGGQEPWEMKKDICLHTKPLHAKKLSAPSYRGSERRKKPTENQCYYRLFSALNGHKRTGEVSR